MWLLILAGIKVWTMLVKGPPDDGTVITAIIEYDTKSSIPVMLNTDILIGDK